MGVCQLDPVTGWCRGCHRTLDEIAGWPTYSIDEKRVVLARIAQRRGGSGNASD
ncbi:MAG: DUF1289 domain-containing protein [Acidiferrobacterales bacterium]|nr:DUF1289 domain-containing protein [Acidiferrobacterales bacterium]